MTTSAPQSSSPFTKRVEGKGKAPVQDGRGAEGCIRRERLVGREGDGLLVLDACLEDQRDSPAAIAPITRSPRVGLIGSWGGRTGDARPA